MVTCKVPGCKSWKTDNPQKYSFHRFPLDAELRKKWLLMLNRPGWVPKKYSSICSKHFEPHCFSNRGIKRINLHSGSVPTLFMPIKLKASRKMSSYIYRDISSIPSNSMANGSDLIEMNKMKKIIDNLRRRLDVKKKRLKNLTAQNKRMNEKMFKLWGLLKKYKKLLTLQINADAAIDSCPKNVYLIELATLNQTIQKD